MEKLDFKRILNILLTIISFVVGFIFLLKILSISATFLIFFIVSCFFIYFLSKRKGIISLYAIIFIIFLDIVFLIFTLIPVYDKEPDLTGFYKQQQNYIKIDINDDTETLKNNMAKVVIKNPNYFEKKYNLWEVDIKNLGNIPLNQQDTIMFISKSNVIKTVVNVYLWDGSIIRIMPQSVLKLSKILKDEKDLLSSKTQVELEKGSIWFKVLRTIFTKDGFNIQTKQGNIIIRGTAGFVIADNDTTNIYSYDHILEVYSKNLNKEFFVSKSESFKLDKVAGQQIAQIPNFDNLKKQINDFVKLDQQYYEQYKNKIIEYIKDKYSFSLSVTNIISKLSFWKMELLNMIDEKYSKNYENYKKFMYITAGMSGTNITNDMLIVPLNENEVYNKLNLMKLKSKENIEFSKSYFINILNKALDDGQKLPENVYNMLNNMDSIEDNLRKLDTYWQALFDNVNNSAVNSIKRLKDYIEEFKK